MSKLEEWKRIQTEEVADCRVFKVRKDFCENSESKENATFYVIENPDWVNIIAATENQEFVLIKQYRQGSEEITLEIPGGMIDQGEEPRICAGRELLEETGFAAKEMIYLGKSRPNPAIQSNWIYHFFAKDCEKISETNFDEHESIETKLASLSEIDILIENEKITHSLVLTGFYRFKNYLKKKEQYQYES